jgi:hypothetical protein
VALYGAAQKIPLTRPGLLLVGPLLHATACKQRIAEPN